MPTIALVPSNVLSKRRPALELGRRLVSAGHRIILVEGTDAHASEGFERRIVDLGTTESIEGIRSARARRARSVATPLAVDRLAGTMRDIAADAVLIDIEEQRYAIAALAIAAGPTVAVFSTFFALWPGRGVPPLDSPVLPATGVRSHLAVARAWAGSWAGVAKFRVRRRLLEGAVDDIALTGALAGIHGVRDRFTRRQWVVPFVPSDIPVLQLTTPELDFPHRVRPTVRIVGPMLKQPGDLDDLDDQRDLATAIQRARVEGRRVILCAFGAHLADADRSFLDRLGQAARLAPGYHFVIATSGEPPSQLTGIDNVTPLSWVPQAEVLQVADAAIVHAGLSTLYECVVTRTPTVLYPFAVNDQLGNAARMQYHGLGIVGDRTHDSPGAIIERLDSVIDDQHIRDRLDLHAVSVARSAADQRLERAVETILER